MAGYEMHFDRALTEGEVLPAVAAALRVPTMTVRVGHEIGGETPDVPVVCRLLSRGGDFVPSLEIFVSASVAGAPEATIARSITAALNCKCPISDASSNPYTWILVGGERSLRPCREGPGGRRRFSEACLQAFDDDA